MTPIRASTAEAIVSEAMSHAEPRRKPMGISSVLRTTHAYVRSILTATMTAPITILRMTLMSRLTQDAFTPPDFTLLS